MNFSRPFLMTRRGALGVAAGVVFATLLAACGQKSALLRYRITVDVETPNGIRSGSSVIENRRVEGSRGFFRVIDRGSADFFGEAVVVNLGGGRYIFALLVDPAGSNDPQFIVDRVLRYPELRPALRPENRDRWLPAYREADALKSRASLRRKDFPALATFEDIGDPATVQIVDPDALDKSFGEGFRLRNITLEVTDDPQKPQIAGLLKWLRANDPAFLDQSLMGKSGLPARYYVKHDSFIRKPL
jgi:hypothetical protein